MWPTLTLLAGLLVAAQAIPPFGSFAGSHIGKPVGFQQFGAFPHTGFPHQQIHQPKFKISYVKDRVTCTGVNYDSDSGHVNGAVAANIHDGQDEHQNDFAHQGGFFSQGLLGKTAKKDLTAEADVMVKYEGKYAIILITGGNIGDYCSAKEMGSGFDPTEHQSSGLSNRGFGSVFPFSQGFKHPFTPVGLPFGGPKLPFHGGALGTLSKFSHVGIGSQFSFGGPHGVGQSFFPGSVHGNRKFGQSQKKYPVGVLDVVDLKAKTQKSIRLLFKGVKKVKQLTGRVLIVCPYEYVTENDYGEAQCTAKPGADACCYIKQDVAKRALHVDNGDVYIDRAKKKNLYH